MADSGKKEISDAEKKAERSVRRIRTSPNVIMIYSLMGKEMIL